MVRCVFPVFPILSLCICVYRFGRICAGENQPVFAIGLPLEAHSSTCRRLGLASTGAFAHDAIEWNINTLEAVVKALNRSLVAGGVTGCCVPGLWCNSVDCFTQSITGNFHNFGHLAAYPAYSPVYSCTDRSRTDADLLVTSALATDGKLYLRSSARAFGTDESRVRIHSDSSAADGYGASASCVRTQICSASCAACASNADCPNYGSCIGDGLDNFCFVNCGGLNDLSCACGMACRAITVNIGPFDFVTMHVCSPNAFNTSRTLRHGACNGFDEVGSVECSVSAPYTYSPGTSSKNTATNGNIANYGNNNINANNRTQFTNFSIVVSDPESSLYSSASLPTSLTSLHFSSSCSHDDNCTRSLDICVVHACVEGRCLSVSADPQCTSTLPYIGNDASPNQYLTVRQRNNRAAQQLFRQRVLKQGAVSSASKYFNSPVHTLDVGFKFLFYGNEVSSIAINPNGVIHVPPYLRCDNVITSVLCIIFSSFTNTISLWASDWSPPFSANLAIYYLKQTKYGPAIDSIISDAVHVMYVDVFKTLEYLNASASTNTFSCSVYADGSVRLRYHEVASSPTRGDVFGLWGARASQDATSELHHYKHMLPPADVRSGLDALFCPYRSVVCPVNACVSPASPLTLLWRGVDCDALAEQLVYRCNWSVENAVTVAELVYDSSRLVERVECPVPAFASVRNGSLISVNIVPFVNAGEIASLSGETYLYGKTSVRGAVVNHHVMVRYFAAPSEACGCSALASAGALECDTCSVCGGNDSTVDCHGDCFGAAYLDSRGVCSRGLTGVQPSSSQGDPTPFDLNDYLFSVLSWLLVLFFMSCIGVLSITCAYVSRYTGERLHLLPQPHNPDRAQRGALFPLRANNNRMRNLAVRIGLLQNALDPSLLGRIGEFKHSMGEQSGNSSGSDCPICLSTFEDDSVCRQLPSPCCHVFHKSCVDEWFLQSHVCPVCRRDVSALQIDPPDNGEISEREVSRNVSGRTYFLVNTHSQV